MRLVVDLLMVAMPFLYGLAAVNYQVLFVRNDPFAARTVTPFLLAVFGLDWLFLLSRVTYTRHFPITTLGEALSLVALAIAGVYLYVERVQREKTTGAFIISLVAVLQLVASALLSQGMGVPSPLFNDPLFELHTVVAVLGYTGFAVGAVYAVMFLLLYRALKKKRFGLIFERLPSLDVLARMAFGATVIGWVFLTATIGVGLLMSIGELPRFWTDPKVVSTVLVWMVYGAYVGSYLFFSWRGARSVVLALAGFAFAVLAMFGSAYLWPSFHKFIA